MSQLTMSHIEEDILASSLRRQRLLLQELIEGLETGTIDREDIDRNMRVLQTSLRKLSNAA